MNDPVELAVEQTETPRLDRAVIYMLKGTVVIAVAVLSVAVIVLCLAALRAAWEMAF